MSFISQQWQGTDDTKTANAQGISQGDSISDNVQCLELPHLQKWKGSCDPECTPLGGTPSGGKLVLAMVNLQTKFEMPNFNVPKMG